MIRSMFEGATVIAWLIVLAVFVLCGCERHQHWHAAGPSAGEEGFAGGGCTFGVSPDHDNHGTAYALALCEVTP